jgi:hypothetical protein
MSACTPLGVHVGQIFTPSTCTSCNSAQNNVFSWGIVIFTRKCLDIAKDRVYISRNVVFNETVYPFQKLNAGARHRAEFLPLPSPFQDHGTGVGFWDGSMIDMLVSPVATNPVYPTAASQRIRVKIVQDWIL